VLKRLAGPVRHYFNSRFSAVHESIVQGHLDDHQLLTAVAGQSAETTQTVRELLATTTQVDEDIHQTLSLLGRTIDDLGDKVELLLEERGTASSVDVTQLSERLEEISRRVGLATFDPATQGQLSQLTGYDAAVANYTNAHDGWSAQAGLWFNPPMSVAHAAGGVSLSHVNERIAEIPFVFRQLAGLAPGSRVLDVGSTESTVPLSLASLGYDVTAVDPRPYPLSHPHLTAFQGPIADFQAEQPFDAVILLSSIEHFGIGAYDLRDEPDADLAAMDKIWEVSRPGTRLVLTTPFGDAPTTALERTYEPGRLASLLPGWKVDEQSYLSRTSPTQWEWRAHLDDLRGSHVVLISATRGELRT
jgi:SAM-dependent methyltransferase